MGDVWFERGIRWPSIWVVEFFGEQEFVEPEFLEFSGVLFGRRCFEFVESFHGVAKSCEEFVVQNTVVVAGHLQLNFQLKDPVYSDHLDSDFQLVFYCLQGSNLVLLNFVKLLVAGSKNLFTSVLGVLLNLSALYQVELRLYRLLFVKVVGLDGLLDLFEGFFVVDRYFCKLEQVLEFFVNCNVTSQCIFDELSIFKFAREIVDRMF